MPFLALALAAVLALQDQPAKQIKSKDPLERLAAVEGLRAQGDKKAVQLLSKALDDDDWEVAERAAAALGELGDTKATDDLVELALEAPVARLRRAAAEALARVDAEEGYDALAKKTRGKTAERACEALVVVGAALEQPDAPRSLARLLREDDARLRAAAARARAASAGPERAEVLAELLGSESLVVQAAGLEAAAGAPSAALLETLAAVLTRDELPGVLERRAARALAAGLGSTPSDAVSQVRGLCELSEPGRAARGPRLAMVLAREEWRDAGELVIALEPARTHAEASVRAAAVRALAELGGEADAVREMAADDASPRVRRAALAATLALADERSTELAGWLVDRLGSEADADVREDLAVALGAPGLEAGVGALIQSLEDPEWPVAVCAAVSLGLTKSERALDPLARLAREHADWRLRGAGVVGLTHLYRKEALPALIEALADDEPLVASTAHHYLANVSRADLEPDVAAWRAWWEERGTGLRLEDPADLEERRRRYGYTVPPQEIFRGLDVCVLASRGDHIEVVLDFLEIPYRGTAAARVDEDGLDAAGVFVSNCTGEVEPADVERIAWFVRAGGYLFGSCWALHETIERVAPGALRKLETRSEVLDAVLASPCAPGSPYLEGVFAPGVRPIYALQGAHLIEVLEPERVEVLIDSPECAERWGGGGELAAWFRHGHGVILDSVNHFDVQGLELATGLKKPEQRTAYAVDHMGLTYADARATRDEDWWDSNLEAAREVKDLSVFELVTNFVRLRRIAGR